MFKTIRWLVPILMLAASHANAQNWPDRPIKFISSQAAGNATDIIARVVAEQLSARLGQPVIVENRPGGGNASAPRPRRGPRLTAIRSSSPPQPRW